MPQEDSADVDHYAALEARNCLGRWASFCSVIWVLLIAVMVDPFRIFGGISPDRCR